MTLRKRLVKKYIGRLRGRKLTKWQLSLYAFWGCIIITLFVFGFNIYKRVFRRSSFVTLMAGLAAAASFLFLYYFNDDLQVRNYAVSGKTEDIKIVSLTGEQVDLFVSVDLETEKYEVKTESYYVTPEDEIMVNQPNTSVPGKHPYYIRVNRAADCVTVYTYDESCYYTVPVKAMPCSTGREEGFTPLGYYKTGYYTKWCFMADATWAQYITGFNGDILFHSVPYYTRDESDLEWEDFNKLGSHASLGCVRLSAKNAKWIFDNCEPQTGVEVYDDADNPGPLGKPASIKISGEYTWDPTDPREDNPYKYTMPSFTGVASRIITVSEPIDLLEGITAYNSCGVDITDKVKIDTDLDLTKIGEYNVTYTAEDELGRCTSASVKFIVIGRGKAVVKDKDIIKDIINTDNNEEI